MSAATMALPGQMSLFDDDPPPPSATEILTAEVNDRPNHRELSEDQRAVIVAKASETLEVHRSLFETVQRTATRYFREVDGGKIHKRDPGLKIRIEDPADGPGDFEHQLLIEPGTKGHKPSVTINPDYIVFVLVRIERNDDGRKMRARLAYNTTRGMARWYERSADLDSARLCKIVERFIADPAKAIAGSGTYCSFCGRDLTDPESRKRGIGPDCFAANGDIMHYIEVIEPEAFIEPVVA